MQDFSRDLQYRMPQELNTASCARLQRTLRRTKEQLAQLIAVKLEEQLEMRHKHVTTCTHLHTPMKLAAREPVAKGFWKLT